MLSYRVSFVNKLPKGGRLFRCCQRVLLIRRARSPERAIEAAKKRFMRCERVEDWRIRAAEIEVEAVPQSEAASDAAPLARRKKPKRPP